MVGDLRAPYHLTCSWHLLQPKIRWVDAELRAPYWYSSVLPSAAQLKLSPYDLIPVCIYFYGQSKFLSIFILMCSIDDTLQVKITDNALSRDLFPMDYHCLGDNENRPVRWMALESLVNNEFSGASDVVSYQQKAECYASSCFSHYVFPEAHYNYLDPILRSCTWFHGIQSVGSSLVN